MQVNGKSQSSPVTPLKSCDSGISFFPEVIQQAWDNTAHQMQHTIHHRLLHFQKETDQMRHSHLRRQRSHGSLVVNHRLGHRAVLPSRERGQIEQLLLISGGKSKVKEQPQSKDSDRRITAAVLRKLKQCPNSNLQSPLRTCALQILGDNKHQSKPQCSQNQKKREDSPSVFSLQYWSEQKHMPRALRFYTPMQLMIQRGECAKFHRLCRFVESTQSTSVLSWLLRITDRSGQSLMHCAAQFDRNESVQSTISCLQSFTNHQLSVDLADHDGLTPMDIAAIHGNGHAVSALLRCGAHKRLSPKVRDSHHLSPDILRLLELAEPEETQIKQASKIKKTTKKKKSTKSSKIKKPRKEPRTRKKKRKSEQTRSAIKCQRKQPVCVFPHSKGQLKVRIVLPSVYAPS